VNEKINLFGFLKDLEGFMRANVLPQIFVNEKNCKNGSKHKK